MSGQASPKMRASADTPLIQLTAVSEDHHNASKLFSLDYLLEKHNRMDLVSSSGVRDEWHKKRAPEVGLILGRKSSSQDTRSDRGDFNVATVSRAHAILNISHNGHIYLTDLGSMHGTQVQTRNSDGQRKEIIRLLPYMPLQLQQHDVIILGKSVVSDKKGHTALELKVNLLYPLLTQTRHSGKRGSPGLIDAKWAAKHFATLKDAPRLIDRIRSSQDTASKAGIELSQITKTQANVDVVEVNDLSKIDVYDLQPCPIFDPRVFSNSSASVPYVVSDHSEHDEDDGNILEVMSGGDDSGNEILLTQVPSDDEQGTGSEEDQDISFSTRYGVPPSILYQSDSEDGFPRDSHHHSDYDDGWSALEEEAAASAADVEARHASPCISSLLSQGQARDELKKDSEECIMDASDSEDDGPLNPEVSAEGESHIVGIEVIESGVTMIEREEFTSPVIASPTSEFPIPDLGRDSPSAGPEPVRVLDLLGDVERDSEAFSNYHENASHESDSASDDGSADSFFEEEEGSQYGSNSEDSDREEGVIEEEDQLQDEEDPDEGPEELSAKPLGDGNPLLSAVEEEAMQAEFHEDYPTLTFTRDISVIAEPPSEHADAASEFADLQTVSPNNPIVPGTDEPTNEWNPPPWSSTRVLSPHANSAHLGSPTAPRRKAEHVALSQVRPTPVRARTPSISDDSTSGPVTPLINLKRALPVEIADETPSPPSKVVKLDAETTPKEQGRGFASSLKLVMLGAAIGSVGTIAGLMQMAE